MKWKKKKKPTKNWCTACHSILNIIIWIYKSAMISVVNGNGCSHWSLFLEFTFKSAKHIRTCFWVWEEMLSFTSSLFSIIQKTFSLIRVHSWCSTEVCKMCFTETDNMFLCFFQSLPKSFFSVIHLLYQLLPERGKYGPLHVHAHMCLQNVVLTLPNFILNIQEHKYCSLHPHHCAIITLAYVVQVVFLIT